MHGSYSEIIFQPSGGGATGGGPAAATQWREPVADLAALAGILTDPEGAARYVDDQDAVYIFVLQSPQQTNNPPDVVNAGSGSWIRVSSGGANLYKVQATAPTSPVDGCLWANTTDDLLYKYDSGRGKWLGIDLLTIQGTLDQVGPNPPSASQDFYIRSTAMNNIPMDGGTDKNGFEAPYNMTLVSLTAHSAQDISVTWDIEVSDQANTKSTTYNVVAADSFYDATTNLDFATGDRIVITASVPDPGDQVNRPIVYAGFRRRTT